MLNKSLSRLNHILNIDDEYSNCSIDILKNTEYRYPKDINISLQNAIDTDNLSKKEAIIIAYSVSVCNNNTILQNAFHKMLTINGISDEECSEIISCVSLMSANNILYRFKHFVEDKNYNDIPVNIKMNIMLDPILGKELFELISLVVSSVNGCECCIQSHEKSLLKLGTSYKRIFDSVRIGSIISALSKIYY